MGFFKNLFFGKSYRLGFFFPSVYGKMVKAVSDIRTCTKKQTIKSYKKMFENMVTDTKTLNEYMFVSFVTKKYYIKNNIAQNTTVESKEVSYYFMKNVSKIIYSDNVTYHLLFGHDWK
jgi:hypothetical protein